MRNNGYIYAIEARDGKVKIGRSCDPIKRVSTIKTISGNSEANSFICDIECDCVKSEKALHSLFNQWRFDGEWFSSPFDEIVNEINIICPNYPPNQQVDKAKTDRPSTPVDYDAFQIASMGFMKSDPVMVVREAFNKFNGVIANRELLRFCNVVAELNNDKFENITDLECFVQSSSSIGE